jgi:hypothetical protein
MKVVPNSLTKPKSKCWKSGKQRKKILVGDDVSFDEIPELMGRTIVGPFWGKVCARMLLVNR